MPQVELPLIIHEELEGVTLGLRNSRNYGWRLSMPRAGYYQITVHPVDARGHRLLVDHVASFNIGLEVFYQTIQSAYLSIDRIFECDGTSYYLSALINVDTWDRVRADVRTQIREGSLPLSLNEAGEIISYDICSRDQLPMALHTHERMTHYLCERDGCDRELISTFAIIHEYIDAHSGNEMLGAVCADPNQCGSDDLRSFAEIQELEYCVFCTRHATETVPRTNVSGYGDINVCTWCDESIVWCDEGDHSLHEDDIMEWGDDGWNICASCYDNRENPRSYIESWNYRPDLIFHPDIPTDPARPLYIGIELEVSWPRWSSEALDWLVEMKNSYGDLIYAKSDSSIDAGFEVVTHPMEPAWALENFPFHFFQAAIEDGALVEHESCGTHIHLDKASLTTAQMYKMLVLHRKLKDFCGLVGGRGTKSSWASWDHYENSITTRLLEIAKKKGEAFGGTERYVPVNVRNEQTIEFRYMKGSIDPEEIKKNIEWVQALYDFTDYISLSDIKSGVLDDPGYLHGWTLNGTYPSLAKWINERTPQAKPMPERIA